MNTLFRKSVAAAVLAGVSLISQAANNGVGGYWVNNIIPNAWAVQNTLMKSVTGANYSCGPTSLLFVSNHYKRLDTDQNSPNVSNVVYVMRKIWINGLITSIVIFHQWA